MKRTVFLRNLRSMSKKEIDEWESDLRTELVRSNTGRIRPTQRHEPQKIRNLRKDLARLLTVKKERGFQ